MKLTGPYFIDSHAPEMAEQTCRAGELGRHGTAR